MYLILYHGMEASSVIVRGNEDMVGPIAAVPEWKLQRNELNRGREKSTCVADGREAINGAEIAGDVDGDEEEISLRWVKCPYITVHQRLMYGHL